MGRLGFRVVGLKRQAPTYEDRLAAVTREEKKDTPLRVEQKPAPVGRQFGKRKT